MVQRDYILATPINARRKTLDTLRGWFGMVVCAVQECGAVEKRIEESKAGF